METDLLIFAGLGLLVAAVCARSLRAEMREHRAFVEHLDRISRRCPSCSGVGLVLETPFGQDPKCTLCNGTGELAAASGGGEQTDA